MIFCDESYPTSVVRVAAVFGKVSSGSLAIEHCITDGWPDNRKFDGVWCHQFDDVLQQYMYHWKYITDNMLNIVTLMVDPIILYIDRNISKISL